MNAKTRRIVKGTAAVTIAATLAPTGNAGHGDSHDGSGGDSNTNGLLLQENKTTRNETFDRPII
ncbi:ABC transporter substrate-binding protein, partial [Streptomyces sp. SP18CS02]|nr:ABC transporter substrate-binding protein [Streptomyces sp. SP18CS02]